MALIWKQTFLMKKTVLIMIISILTASCAAIQPAPAELPLVQKILEVPDMTKGQIYENSRLWIAQNFKPYRAVWLYKRKTGPVVEYANEKAGILIATGTIHYPYKAFSLTEGHKLYWEVTFTMEEYIKDGRVMVTFRNIDIYVPNLSCGNAVGEWLGAYDKPLTDPEDIKAVRPVLTGLAERLGEFLRSPGTAKQW